MVLAAMLSVWFDDPIVGAELASFSSCVGLSVWGAVWLDVDDLLPLMIVITTTATAMTITIKKASK